MSKLVAAAVNFRVASC